MAEPSWTNIAAPNFAGANDLLARAMEGYASVGTSLQKAAQGYQDALRKRNHGILQDFINSAKTPEELQSEQFQQRFKNLQATLQNEYDAQVISQYRDNRGDVLLKRAADQAALDRNKWGLSTDQLKEATRIGMNNLATLANDPIAYAAEVARLKALNQFDPSIEQARQLGAAQLTQTNNAIDLYDHTKGELYKAPGLENASREAATESALGQLKIAQAKAPFENALLDAQAAAARDKKNNPVGGFTPEYFDKVTAEGIKNIRTAQQPLYDGVKGKFTYVDMDAVDKAILKDETWSWAGMPGTAKKAKEVINSIPELAGLPKAVKAATYMGLINKVRADNMLGKDDWFTQDRDKYVTFAIEAAKDNMGYLEAAKAQEKTAIQDLAMHLSRISMKDPTTTYNYVLSQLGASPLDQYKLDPEAAKKIQEGNVTVPPVPQVPTSSAAKVIADRATAQTAPTSTDPRVKMLQEQYNQTKDLMEKAYLQSKIDELTKRP